MKRPAEGDWQQGKRPKWPAEGDEVRAQAAWRAQAFKRILSNSVPARVLQEDLKAAQAAGAVGCEDILTASCPHNAKRDLMRQMLRSNEWPDLYWTDITVADLKTGKTKAVKMPFLLPHEWLPLCTDQFAEAREDLKPTDAWLQEHLQKVGRDLKVSPAELFVAMGMHGDGVPINGTMNEDSLEVFNLNLCTSKKHSHLRVPFACVQLKHTVKNKTFAGIVSVLCWSLRCLATGKRPGRRHDGSPFNETDKARSKAAGEGRDLGVRAVLAEIRGDWMWLQKLFGFPTWNLGTGFCWLCHCKVHHMRLPDTAVAPWRFQRKSGEQCLQFLRAQGKPICDIFSLPGVSPAIVFPDWMHSADMGVTQDVIAHFFHELLPRMQGSTERSRCYELFGLLLKFYKAYNVEDRLQTLEVKNFTVEAADKPNKMKCKAAEARALVPFLPKLGAMFLNMDDVKDAAVQAVVSNLATCYAHMEDPGPVLQKACRRLCNAYSALANYQKKLNPKSAHWHIKPKLHLFQELREFGKRSALFFWCYRDESFGNLCAQLAVRRGGPDSPGHNASRVLQGWCCSTALPKLR